VDLYLVRHAIAFDRDASQWPDDRERPLTEEGARRFRRVARRLRGVVPEVGACLSSPLARAWQTAATLQEVSGWPAPEPFAELEPGRSASAVIRALKAREPAGSIALVGHEPGLHELASCLLLRSETSVVFELKKGGIARLVFEGPPKAGGARLRWLFTPGAVLGLKK